MRKTITLLLLTFLGSCGMALAQTQDKWGDHTFQGQATFGGDTTSYIATPSSAWLRIGRDSTTKGVLPPRVGDTSDITDPAFGLTIFSHADSCYYVYKDKWVKVGSNISDYIRATEKGIANGVATLDSTGKLTSGQVPAIAITNTYVVDSMAAMLALSADTGDICIRSDSSETFILQSTPATAYDNWKKLLSPGAPVTSVNGKTGTVTLGVDDITGAVNLTGTQTISGAKLFSEVQTFDGTVTVGSSSSDRVNIRSLDDNISFAIPGLTSKYYTLVADNLTDNRHDTLQDKSGTIAMTNDTGYVHTSGSQTVDGAKTFSSKVTSIGLNLFNGSDNKITLLPVGDSSVVFQSPGLSRSYYLRFPTSAASDRNYTFPDNSGKIWSSGGDDSTSGNVHVAGEGWFGGIVGFGGTPADPDATINGLGQISGQTLSIGSVFAVTNPGAVTAATPFSLVGTSSSGSNVSFVSFYQSDGSTRVGIVGDESITNQDMYLFADVGAIRLHTGGADQLVISTSGDATFAQSVTSTEYKLSALNTAPTSATDAGTKGEIRITADYIYVCTATNTWVRAALSTW